MDKLRAELKQMIDAATGELLDWMIGLALAGIGSVIAATEMFTSYLSALSSALP